MLAALWDVQEFTQAYLAQAAAAAPAERWPRGEVSVCAQGVRCEKASCGGVLLAPQRPAADAGGGAESSNGAAPAPEEWACCECGRTKPGRTPQGGGCQDAVYAAQHAWQLSMALMQAGVRASRIVCSLSLSCWRAVVRISRALLLGSVVNGGQQQRQPDYMHLASSPVHRVLLPVQGMLRLNLVSPEQ